MGEPADQPGAAGLGRLEAAGPSMVGRTMYRE